MDKEKVNRLKKHASNMNYEVNEELSSHIADMINDSTITLRLPRELKQGLKTKAAEKGLKYQKYLRSLIIEDLKKHG